METPFVIFKEECYNAWKDMTEGYSRRRLSMMSDKFPAVSGLASEFAYLVDDEYIGGLWRKDLCRGLSWWGSETTTRHLKGISQPASQLQVSNYGPSWSWAKMTIPISYDLGRYQEGRHPQTLTVLKSEIGWRDPIILHVNTIPEGRDPNGTLISGTIHLRGQIIPFSRSKTGNCIIKGEYRRVGLVSSTKWEWFQNLGFQEMPLI